MTRDEAAALLGIAAYEVLDVQGGRVLVHDMTSHDETWRPLPGVPVDEPVAEEPPDGTAAEVLAWVGDDPNRAEAAAVAEQDRDKPRATLLAALRKVEGR